MPFFCGVSTSIDTNSNSNKMKRASCYKLRRDECLESRDCDWIKPESYLYFTSMCRDCGRGCVPKEMKLSKNCDRDWGESDRSRMVLFGSVTRCSQNRRCKYDERHGCWNPKSQAKPPRKRWWCTKEGNGRCKAVLKHGKFHSCPSISAVFIYFFHTCSVYYYV